MSFVFAMHQQRDDNFVYQMYAPKVFVQLKEVQ